jgi:hypothetical protein
MCLFKIGKITNLSALKLGNVLEHNVSLLIKTTKD